MLLNKKTVSLVMVFSVTLTAASCRNEEGSGEETGGYEAAYYSTKLITIPQDSFVLRSFYDGENVNFISGSIDGDDEEFHYTNTLYVYDLEGGLISENVLQDCDLRISDACAISNGRFAVVGGKEGEGSKCFIYDQSGTVLGSMDMDSPAYWPGSVCRTDDGFILCTTGRICRYLVYALENY